MRAESLERLAWAISEAGRDYVQDKVGPGTGREGDLGYERYIAKEHMDKVRAGTAREGSLGCVRRDRSDFALWIIETKKFE